MGRHETVGVSLTHETAGSLAVARARLAHLPLTRPGQAALATAILVLAWPFRSQFPRVTLDLSWKMGLHQAARDGLAFGRDIVFTYGPLGFLSWPTPFIGPTSVLAFVATAAIYLALVGLLLRASLRVFPAWVAVLLTLVFARAIGWLEPFDALQILRSDSASKSCASTASRSLAGRGRGRHPCRLRDPG